MLLLIAIGIAIVYALLAPLANGLYDTSMWLAKILAPIDSEDNATTRQFIKISQAALMDGWLSNIPFTNTLLHFSCIIIGFCYSWWGGILMIILPIILGMVTKSFMTHNVSYYTVFIYTKMINRAADFKRKNDTDRYEASESYCRELEMIIAIFQNSKMKPPTKKQLKDVPYGEFHIESEKYIS